MPFFDLFDGRLAPARNQRKVEAGVMRRVLSAVSEQIIELLGHPLMPVAWFNHEIRQAPSRQVAAASQLLALDATGRIVTLEVHENFDSAALVKALARAGKHLEYTRADIAAMYPGGNEVFARDWQAFSESCPPTPGNALRLVIIAANIDDEARPALETLAGAGLEVHELRVVDDNWGRVRVELEEIRPGWRPLFGHVISASQARHALPTYGTYSSYGAETQFTAGEVVDSEPEELAKSGSSLYGPAHAAGVVFATPERDKRRVAGHSEVNFEYSKNDTEKENLNAAFTNPIAGESSAIGAEEESEQIEISDKADNSAQFVTPMPVVNSPAGVRATNISDNRESKAVYNGQPHFDGKPRHFRRADLRASAAVNDHFVGRQAHIETDEVPGVAESFTVDRAPEAVNNSSAGGVEMSDQRFTTYRRQEPQTEKRLTRRQLRNQSRPLAQLVEEAMPKHPDYQEILANPARLAQVLRQLAALIGAPVELHWRQRRQGIKLSAALTAWGTIVNEDGSAWSSPTEAAEQASGRSSVNGWEVWKITDGRSLAQALTESHLLDS